jgi:hypothetical protein
MSKIKEQNPAHQQAHSHGLSYLLLVVAIAFIGVVYLWQHGKVVDSTKQATSLSAALEDQNAQTADREKALSSLPNTVIDAGSSSVDLIAFLGSDNTQCYKETGSSKGYYKVVKEVSGKFAKMQYGCVVAEGSAPSGPPSYILAKKLDNKWQTISPTNQWSTVDGANLPSCKMINDNKLLEPKCYAAQPGADPSKPTVEPVTNP